MTEEVDPDSSDVAFDDRVVTMIVRILASLFVAVVVEPGGLFRCLAEAVVLEQDYEIAKSLLDVLISAKAKLGPAHAVMWSGRVGPVPPSRRSAERAVPVRGAQRWARAALSAGRGRWLGSP